MNSFDFYVALVAIFVAPHLSAVPAFTLAVIAFVLALSEFRK